MATADPYHEEVYWVGIDAGSVSLNCVVIDQEREIVSEIPFRRHRIIRAEESFPPVLTKGGAGGI